MNQRTLTRKHKRAWSARVDGGSRHPFNPPHYLSGGFRIAKWRLRMYKVVNSGIDSLVLGFSIEKYLDLDPSIVSNEIKECDEAIGYTRSQRQK